MKITQAVCSPGRTGFYFDDQRAIKAGAGHDGMAYSGDPLTPGFERIRIPGEAVSIQFLLEDGQIAYGDCAAVQYSGAGGRDPVFLAKKFMPMIAEHVFPEILNTEITSYDEVMQKVESIRVDGKPLHTAIRYGLSQALLDAIAKSNHELMCETLAREYGTTVSEKAIPIFMQSGDARELNADKMILKGADVLPHALINNVKEKLGLKGELLVDYVRWLTNRIKTLRIDPSYSPAIHLDVYGTIGEIFPKNDWIAISDYLAKLADLVAPFQLRVEGPIDYGEHDAQRDGLAALTATLDKRGIPVEIVADEWCNTFEDVKEFADAKAGHMIQIKTPDLGSLHNSAKAVLYCNQAGVGAYLGGTCNETDRSAQVTTHVAMATSPVQMLAKPGMGVDEGFMIIYNEMQRILAFRAARKYFTDAKQS